MRWLDGITDSMDMSLWRFLGPWSIHTDSGSVRKLDDGGLASGHLPLENSQVCPEAGKWSRRVTQPAALL